MDDNSAVSSVKGDELKSFVPNIANMLNGGFQGWLFNNGDVNRERILRQ